MMCRVSVSILICFGNLLVATTYVQNFYWRHYAHGEIPKDALEVFPGMYVGQAHFCDGDVPAAIYPHRNSVIAMYGPRMNPKDYIKILCTPEPEKFYWASVNFNTTDMFVMKDAVVGGAQEGSLLFIGLVKHLGNWKIGKVFPVDVEIDKGVYVWGSDGSRVILYEFQLLKYNSSSRVGPFVKY